MKATIWTPGQDVTEPGVYLGVPMDDYRRDPCPAPSLNRTIAHTALFKSLEHAQALHPKLNPDAAEDEGAEDEDEPKKITRAMDIGSAAHSLAFGVGAAVAVIHEKNWRTKAAKEARDAAREIGEIPLLAKEFKKAKAMADRAGPIITALLDGSVVAEAMVVWQNERGLWRRILIDRARADFRVVIDYKTTNLEIAPAEARRLVYTSGAYFQEAFYRPGLDTLDPEGAGRRRFCFLYQEQASPFTVTLVETDEAGRTLGEEQVTAACNLWDRALVTGEWPGHALGPHISSPPPWLIESWARRAEHDETLNDWIP